MMKDRFDEIGGENTDVLLKRIDEQIKKLGLFTEWDRLINKVRESLFYNNVLSLFGIEITGVCEPKFEVDLICVGRKGRQRIVAAVEVKSSFGVRDVKKYIKQLDQFFEFFINYHGWDLIGVVAGVRWSRQAIALAEKEGLYILAPSGETMVALNRKGFKPRIWR